MDNSSQLSNKARKFVFNDDAWMESFVKNGFIIFTDIFERAVVNGAQHYLMDKFHQLLAWSECDLSRQPDIHGWSVAIAELFSKTSIYEDVVLNRKLVCVLKALLGPDIAIFNQDALWINVPKDSDPVLLKGIHNDAWTGTSVNTLFTKFFFTDVDDYNGITVYPGSHLFGMVPVRNRSIDPACNLELTPLNLSNIRQGDVLLWHPLLLHSTTGHSNESIRISLTSRYTSPETTFSSQERALGYRVISVGPLNQILRLVGNDYLTPFRTLGGFVGVDRRLSKLYGFSDYSTNNDYISIISDQEKAS